MVSLTVSVVLTLVILILLFYRKHLLNYWEFRSKVYKLPQTDHHFIFGHIWHLLVAGESKPIEYFKWKSVRLFKKAFFCPNSVQYIIHYFNNIIFRLFNNITQKRLGYTPAFLPQ